MPKPKAMKYQEVSLPVKSFNAPCMVVSLALALQTTPFRVMTLMAQMGFNGRSPGEYGVLVLECLGWERHDEEGNDLRVFELEAPEALVLTEQHASYLRRNVLYSTCDCMGSTVEAYLTPPKKKAWDYKLS